MSLEVIDQSNNAIKLLTLEAVHIRIGAKLHGNIEISLEQPIEKIGSFDGLTVLIVQFDDLGEVNLK